MTMLGPEFASHRAEVSKAYSSGKREDVMKAQEEMSALKRRFGINTSLQLFQITQLPFLIMFFWTIQDMSYDIIKYSGMLTDGFLWFSNLAEPDPYFLLPLALASTTFMSIHVLTT
jgi:YidC/Oxa1 family membrane protein insertase